MSSDPEHTAPPTDSGSGHHQSDLFSSASVLASAARSTFSHDGAALDKAKLAEAAEDVVDNADKYGKLKERGYGNYVEKAETYLHQLHPSSGKKPTDHSPAAKEAAEGKEEEKKAHPEESKAHPEESKAHPEESKGHDEEKKASEEHHSSGGFGGFGGGGFGDYMKKAEGFLKK